MSESFRHDPPSLITRNALCTILNHTFASCHCAWIEFHLSEGDLLACLLIHRRHLRRTRSVEKKINRDAVLAALRMCHNAGNPSCCCPTCGGNQFRFVYFLVKAARSHHPSNQPAAVIAGHNIFDTRKNYFLFSVLISDPSVVPAYCCLVLHLMD